MRQFPKPTRLGTAPKEDFTPEDVTFILNTNLRPEHLESPKVMAFISAYLMCRDMPQSAREAGLTRNQGRMLLNRKDIHAAIRKVTEIAVVKYGLDPDEIVEKVKEVAFFDPIDCVREDGTAIENIRDIPAHARRALKKMKVKNLYEKDPNGMPIVTGKLVEYEFFDKLKANEFLGREKGLFKETKVTEHDVTTNMRDVLLESKDRAEERMKRAREDDTIDVTPSPSKMPRPEGG